MDVLKLKVVPALAFIVSAGLIGVAMTSILGHLLTVIATGALFAGSFYYRVAASAKRGVVIHPDSQAAFEKGLGTFLLVVAIGMLVFPAIIPIVFWLGIIQYAWVILVY